MIRKLILPALAILLLAGCATGYTYRAASGDYYYGQPGVVYRDYYNGYYYNGYFSPYSSHSYYRYRFGYGYPYGYYGRYPWRYHGYPHSPRPGNDHGGGHDNQQPDRPTPPWRDLDRVGHEARPDVPRSDGLRVRPVRPQTSPAPVQRTAPVQRPAVRGGGERRGSAMSEMIRRAQPNRDVRPTIEP